MSDHCIENPEEQIIADTKTSHKKISAHPPLPPRLKFSYTVVEKPKHSCAGTLAVMVWILMVVGLFCWGYFEKVSLLRVQSEREREECATNFHKNRCETKLKATAQYCEEKRKCMESTVEELLNLKINTGFIVGELAKDMVEGAGIYVCVSGLLILFAIIKRAPEREIRREYHQYCN